MKRVAAMLLALACVHVAAPPREPEFPPDDTPAPTETPAESPACPEPTVTQPPPCRLNPPPTQPTIAWVAPGCPPQFLSCLSGADSGVLVKYLRDVRAWTHDAYKRCGRGR